MPTFFDNREQKDSHQTSHSFFYSKEEKDIALINNEYVPSSSKVLLAKAVPSSCSEMNIMDWIIQQYLTAINQPPLTVKGMLAVKCLAEAARLHPIAGSLLLDLAHSKKNNTAKLFLKAQKEFASAVQYCSKDIECALGLYLDASERSISRLHRLAADKKTFRLPDAPLTLAELLSDNLGEKNMSLRFRP
jgi:hypothetical protein